MLYLRPLILKRLPFHWIKKKLLDFILTTQNLCQETLNNDAKIVSLKILHLLFLMTHCTSNPPFFIFNDTIF